MCSQGKYIEAKECCDRALTGCRWYTATSDESKEQHNGDGNNGGDGSGTDKDNDNNNNNDDNDDDGVDDDVILDMDTLHTLYNLANLLQIQGTCQILLPCLFPCPNHS